MSRGDRDPNRGMFVGTGRGLQRGIDRIPLKELAFGSGLTVAATWIGGILVVVGIGTGVYKVGSAAAEAVGSAFNGDAVEVDIPMVSAGASVNGEDVSASIGDGSARVPGDIAANDIRAALQAETGANSAERSVVASESAGGVVSSLIIVNPINDTMYSAATDCGLDVTGEGQDIKFETAAKQLATVNPQFDYTGDGSWQGWNFAGDIVCP